MILSRIRGILKNQDERTRKAQLNIIYSFLIKGVSILTYLLLVPITLRFLNPVEYGIWLTLNSILMWVNTFDIGLGNGLRNKLTEAFAKDDHEKAKIYVSTTYTVLFFVMIALFILFFIINKFLWWPSILNIDASLVPNIDVIVLMSFGLFCVTFILKLIGNIYLALQKAALNNFLVMMGQLLSLILIYIFSFKDGSGDLFSVALIYSISPVFVYLVAYPLTFKGEFRYLLPNIKFYRREYIKSLMGLGGQFFLIQIAGLIIFSTSNLIITNRFGPESVTVYNVAYRYYSVVPMLFSIILTPIWSATTDAYVRKDYDWINRSMKKVKKLLAITFFGLIIMTCLAPFIYKLWVGNAIQVPNSLSVLMAIYIFVLVLSLSYSSFLNGTGILRLQVWNTVVAALLFIPLTLGFGLQFGIQGITLVLIIVNLSGVVFNILQFNKILSGSAKGIWAR
jgi:O-antigen/teichoic acid export membrane protein